jgi:hypothetical protein
MLLRDSPDKGTELFISFKNTDIEKRNRQNLALNAIHDQFEKVNKFIYYNRASDCFCTTKNFLKIFKLIIFYLVDELYFHLFMDDCRSRSAYSEIVFSVIYKIKYF